MASWRNTCAQRMSGVLRGCVDDGQEYLYSMAVKTEEAESKEEETRYNEERRRTVDGIANKECFVGFEIGTLALK